MGLLNFLKPKEVVVEVTAPLTQATVEIGAKEVEGFRVGMWVMTSDGVGIMTPEGVVLIKEDGTNRMKLNEEDKAVVHMAEVAERQAFLEEIPASRRPPVDNIFGYRSAQ